MRLYDSEKCENNVRITEEDTKTAMRVSVTSIAVNTVLSLLKLAAGFIAGSGAMISDAVHSASDVFSTLVVMIGVRAASKESDKEHPFGHERLECVASIVLAVVLAITGAGIGFSGIKNIASGAAQEMAVPGTIALAAAVISVVVKEAMFWYTRAAAKKINSGALMADAWHHRSDAMSSVGSFAGILGARMGFPVLDPLASVVICVFIGKAALEIFMDAVDKMVDRSCPEEMEAEMKRTVMEVKGIEAVDDLRTRLFGSRIYVEVEIAMDGSVSLLESHDAAEKVHDLIEERFKEVKHCMVHVNPLV